MPLTEEISYDVVRRLVGAANNVMQFYDMSDERSSFHGEIKKSDPSGGPDFRSIEWSLQIATKGVVISELMYARAMRGVL